MNGICLNKLNCTEQAHALSAFSVEDGAASRMQLRILSDIVDVAVETDPG